MKHTVIGLISCILCSIFTLSLSAQSYQLKFVDASTSDALIGANVQLNDKVLVTDNIGLVQFEWSSSMVEIKVSYVGYEDLKITVKSSPSLQIMKMVPSSSLLEMATISSSKYEISLAETTVSLELLQPQIIDNNNIVSLDAVLDKVPGIQMVGDNANIRGGSGFSYGSGSRVMLLIDDIPALTMDSGSPNWSDIPIENIAQIEVLKGAASSLYGSSALNGIINIRTGLPSTEPETKISIAYTSYGSPKESEKKWWDKAPSSIYLNFLHKRKFGKLDIVVNGNYYNLDSYNKDSKSKRGRFGFKTRYRLSDKWSVSLNGLYNAAENQDFFLWKNEVETYEPLEGATSSRTIKRWQIDPGMQYFSDNGFRHTWKNRITSIKNDNDNNQSVEALSYFTEYQLQKTIPIVDVNTVIGGTFSSVRSEADLYGGDIFSYSNYAGFLQMDKKLFKRLNISAGTRFESNHLVSLEGTDRPSLSGTELVSRAGLNFKLFKASYLRANWGQGYRFPTIAERYIRTTISALVIFPNEELEPEKGWTSEIGFKQGLKIGNWKGYIDVAGFYQSYKDMMEFVFVVDVANAAIGFQSQNIGNTNITGFEIGIGSQSKIGNIPINILAGYTYLDPKYDYFLPSTAMASSVEYNVLKYRSKHNVKLDIEAVFKAIDIGVSLQTTSPMLAIDQAFEDMPFVGDFAGIGAYRAKNNNTRHVLNIRVGYSWNNIKLGLLLNNVLNEAYTLRPGLMEAPRNMSMKLSYKL